MKQRSLAACVDRVLYFEWIFHSIMPLDLLRTARDLVCVCVGVLLTLILLLLLFTALLQASVAAVFIAFAEYSPSLMLLARKDSDD